MDHILSSTRQDLEILVEPAKSTEPSETALNHPRFRKDSLYVFDFGGNVQDESACLVDELRVDHPMTRRCRATVSAHAGWHCHVDHGVENAVRSVPIRRPSGHLGIP